MPDTLTFDELKAKQRTLRSGFPESMGLRVHRAISWIGRAQKCGDDDDARFMFLWIAFNAAYADENKFQAGILGARTAFDAYFDKLIKCDKERRIHYALWDRFSGPVRSLMANKFVFAPFWEYHNGMEGSENWAAEFKKDRGKFASAFKAGKSIRVLNSVFDALYVLRNQLMHGGSTWNSSVNRDNVRDGAAILTFLMPVFVDLMMDNPQDDWGRPFYPVVEPRA